MLYWALINNEELVIKPDNPLGPVNPPSDSAALPIITVTLTRENIS